MVGGGWRRPAGGLEPKQLRTDAFVSQKIFLLSVVSPKLDLTAFSSRSGSESELIFAFYMNVLLIGPQTNTKALRSADQLQPKLSGSSSQNEVYGFLLNVIYMY